MPIKKRVVKAAAKVVKKATRKVPEAARVTEYKMSFDMGPKAFAREFVSHYKKLMSGRGETMTKEEAKQIRIILKERMIGPRGR